MNCLQMQPSQMLGNLLNNVHNSGHLVADLCIPLKSQVKMTSPRGEDALFSHGAKANQFDLLC